LVMLSLAVSQPHHVTPVRTAMALFALALSFGGGLHAEVAVPP